MPDPYRHAKAGMPGSSVRDGVAYHDIPGYEGSVHRSGTKERVGQILNVYNVKGKRGLDIGCGPGGIAIELARNGATMVGIDQDGSAIAVGAEVRNAEPIRLAFFVADVESFVPLLLEDDDYDFAVWFSQYMWLAKQHGKEKAEHLLYLIASSVPVLFFETATRPGDGMAGAFGPRDPEALLRKHYAKVTDLGPIPGNWEGKRHVYFCEQ